MADAQDSKDSRFHGWYDQNRKSIETKLAGNFSLVNENTTIRGKRVKNKTPLVAIDLKKQPDFIRNRIFSLRFRLDSISSEQKEEVVGGIKIKHEPVDVAKVSGIISYNLYDKSPKKEHQFTAFMEVGDVLDFLDVSDLHTGLLHVLDATYPVCQLKVIDPINQSVTIGPVPDNKVDA